MLPFPVWDAPQFAATENHLSSVVNGGSIASIIVRRQPLKIDRAALSVHSFRPAEYAESVSWPKGQAALDLLGGEVGPGAPSTRVAELMVQLRGEDGGPTALSVDGRTVDARRLDVPAIGWIVWSVDPAFGLSVAGYDIDLPELQTAHIDDFDANARAHLRLS
jgi:hypothetical protein